MDDGSTRTGSGVADTVELSAQVRTTIGRVYRRFRSERPEGGLGDTALEILGFLDKNGPHTLTDLSDIGQVAPATMSQSLNRLTTLGYAIRTKDATDRRKVLFSTTPAGAELAVATRVQRNAWLKAQLEKLSPTEQNDIARACVLLNVIADSELA